MRKYLENFKSDIPAGLVVFLVALPLCLGIATASGTNAFAGVIAGVIGGIVVTIVSKSKFGVSGPAAGMITIVLVAIETLGFPGFLMALVIAGVLQFLFGQFKLGFVAHFIPNSVIIGMLASIGIVLILKQFPHAIGFDTSSIGEFEFKEHNSSGNTFTQIEKAWRYSTPASIIISVISLFTMLAWDSKFLKKFKFFRLIPAALVVVIVGIIMNLLFKHVYTDYRLESFHLVHLPYQIIEGLEALTTGNLEAASNVYTGLVTFPDFGAVLNKEVWITGVIMALVASIQTLLTVEATDKIDPEKNMTPPNIELKAQGIGNLISGLLGGIPIAQVIVRSSANINAGAKSKMGSLFHGIFLLLIVLLLPKYINLIPLASLAVILIVLGYKLANPKIMYNTWKKGWDQFIPFVITIVAIIFTDLLRGIGIGLVISMITILRTNYRSAFTIKEKKGVIVVSFIYIVTFLNKGSLARALHELPENSIVKFDARKCHFISFDILKILTEYSTIVAKRKNITVEYDGFERYDLESDNFLASQDKKNNPKKGVAKATP